MSVLNPKSLSPSHVLYYYVCAWLGIGHSFLENKGSNVVTRDVKGVLKGGILENLKGKQNLKCKYNHFH